VQVQPPLTLKATFNRILEDDDEKFWWGDIQVELFLRCAVILGIDNNSSEKYTCYGAKLTEK